MVDVDVTSTNDGPTWETYRDEDNGVAAEAPSTWDGYQGLMGSSIAVLEPETGGQRFRANVNIVIGPRDTASPTLADQCIKNLAMMSDTLTDPELLDAGPISGPLGEGHRVLVTYRDGREALTMEQWYWPMSSDRVAVVTATAPNDRYAECAPGFEHMATSLAEA